ncbi:insulinoma-associated protein 1a [Trichomycterus rosablanca]|uniref:insulinoma-associated protein 1a n=1 Tax=Trichomycterus rosablanca TaxID=2290929 RepID=UPI002F358696
MRSGSAHLSGRKVGTLPVSRFGLIVHVKVPCCCCCCCCCCGCCCVCCCVLKMPRGFLVKRSRKAAPMSYRIRCSEHENEDARETQVYVHKPGDARGGPDLASLVASAPRADSLSQPVRFGNPDTLSQSVYSPTRPVSREQRVSIGSPVSAESYPVRFDQQLGYAPMDLKISASNSAGVTASKRAHPEPERKSKPAPKKAKAMRKLQFEDEVTTSPVLGLRIKEGPVEQKVGADKQLGEFVCRLCGEAYADPFALAQHRCSRIVRVEYRCPECDKAFSCPANLASHRRWHKPKHSNQTGGEGTDKKSRATEHGRSCFGKEPRAELEQDRNTPSPGVSESGSGSGSDLDGLYECQRCVRKFKRQAYLKKHIQTHHTVLSLKNHAPGQEPEQKHVEQAQPPVQAQVPLDSIVCPVCGETFPSRMAQERHVRVHHASHVYPCKHCPAAFYSSPALTRHINKCHPSENRQVILLQVPVRPAC